jgi:hypothetical protein
MLQLVFVIDGLALLMFNRGVDDVSSNQLLGCVEAYSSGRVIELCGLFGGLVSNYIPWHVHVCRHPGDVDVCWQLLQGSFQGGNLSEDGVHQGLAQRIAIGAYEDLGDDCSTSSIP